MTKCHFFGSEHKPKSQSENQKHYSKKGKVNEFKSELKKTKKYNNTKNKKK